MKDKTLSPDLAKIELHPDAMERFEKFVTAIAKVSAPSSKAKKKGIVYLTSRL